MSAASSAHSLHSHSAQRGELIVRLPNWIGDVVLAVPALQWLEAEGWRLQLLGKRWAPTLLSGFGWPVHVRDGTLRQVVRQLRALRPAPAPGQRLAPALVMPASLSSALELRLAGFGAVGFAKEGRSLLLAKALPIPQGVHTLERWWALARCWAAPHHQTAQPPRAITWRITAAAQSRAKARLAAAGITGGYRLICPFGGSVDKQGKCWPAFAEFAHTWAQVPGGEQAWPILLCPGPAELAEAQQRFGDFAQVLADVALDEYAALLAGARQVVANDTGPGHLAAAVGVPLVSVLGPTDPQLWAPWGERVRIVQHWPRWPTVDEVLAAVQAQSAAWPRTAG